MEPEVNQQFACMIYPILHIFFLFIFCLLSIYVCYLLVISVAGLFTSRVINRETTQKKKIAVLIPTYKEDNVIVQTVKMAATHNYPPSQFHVYVAADHLQPATIKTLKQFDAEIFEVQFHKGSKARSLNFLLNHIDEKKFDVALILDGDNIMEQGFLEKLNTAFHEGAVVIQAHRTAKNLHTPIAVLDALSEEVNNHFFRKAQSVLGFSASLIGSGMAFPFALLKSVYNKPGILDNPACDREVDFEMLVSGTRVIYLNDAHVLDEKVAEKKVYENQRRRWLESQWVHLRMFFHDWKRVKNKNADFWNKLFLNLIPPRILMLAAFFILLCICTIQYFSGINITGLPVIWWIVLFVVYLLSIVAAIPRMYFNRRTLLALFHVPALLYSFIKASLTMKRNRREFVHTPKSYVEQSAADKRHM